jgi:NAD(P)-dependent dehydrogenase (short-subunit alcohol dehydrogenase family)
MSKIWFITGASRGLGRVWAEAALERGDKVAATARSLEGVSDLKERFGDAVLPLQLDVTDAARVPEAVQQAFEHFGRLDVLVNNAGYSLIAATEEATDEQIANIFDANYTGVVRVVRAALPLMRKQGSGHIVGVTSSLGVVPSPLIGVYAATKAATESLHESLAKEVAQFGIKVTMIEPGAYATEFGKSAARANPLEVYDAFRRDFMAGLMKLERGNPKATSEALFKIVDTEQPPLRLILGSMTLPQVRATYAERLATWDAWQAVSEAAQ